MKLKTLLLCLIVLPSYMMAYSDYHVDADGINYYLDSSTLEAFVISGDNPYPNSTLNIPSTVTANGVVYNVTKIDDNAFSENKNIQIVTIPNSVTFIGYSAFSGCSSITSINIPNSVTSIGDWGFNGCSSLTSITVPNSVTSIGGSAFSDCSSLTSINIPNGVTTIGSCAFSGCSSLTTVTIPSSVKSIDNTAFQESGLSTVIFNAENYSGGTPFWYCKIQDIEVNSPTISLGIFATDMGATTYTSRIKNLKIGKDVSQITGVGACAMSLSTIQVDPQNGVYESPGSCNAIIHKATNELIKGCSNTIIPTTVTNIGEYSFFGCSLSSISIPSSVTSIGSNAFYYCYDLASVTFDSPSSLTTIENDAFYYCRNLSSITIPSSVTSIGDCAFVYCEALPSINIPSGVSSIGDYTFNYCTSLASITFDSPSSLTSIGECAFKQCAFASIIIPNSVTTIEEDAFDGCTNLSTVDLGTGLQSIGEYAFNCENLFKVICRAKTVPSAEDRAFGEYATQSTLYVPKSAVGDYKTAKIWRNFKEVLPIEPLTVITFDSFTREYGDANPTFTYTLTGNPLTVKPTCVADATSAPGDYPITMPNPGDPDEIEIIDGTLTVTQAPLIISAVSCTIKEGDALPKFQLNYNGFKNSENETCLTTQPTVTPPVNNSCVPGVYDIIANGATSPNYNISYVNGTLTITPASGMVDITISSYGAATFCADFDLDFSGITDPDFKACIITGYLPETKSVLAVPVTDAPAGTGLYIIGNPGTYSAALKTTSSYYVNMLVGVKKDTSVPQKDGEFTNLFLSPIGTSLAFQPSSKAMPVTAHKAYLQIPTSVLPSTGGGAFAVNVVFEEDATGISDISGEKETGEWYTLSGVRVEHPTKGIYIHNGRKVVLK